MQSHLRWIPLVVLIAWAVWWPLPRQWDGASADKTIGEVQTPLSAPLTKPAEETTEPARTRSADALTSSETSEAVQSTQAQLLQAIAEAYQAGSAEHLERITENYFPALIAHDFDAALHYVWGLQPGQLRELLLPRLVRHFAARDFASAVEWLARLSDPVERKEAFSEACFSAAEADPEEAVRSWNSQKFETDEGVLENLVQRWAVHDLPAAREWVLAQPAGPRRDEAVRRVSYVLSQRNPKEAASLILRELPAGSLQTEAAMSVLHQWALSDAAGAASWVQKFPDGPLAQRARQELHGIIEQKL